MRKAEPDSPHQPVLYHEIISALRPTRNRLYADLTAGAGGHAWGILEASQPDGKLLGLEVDPQALSIARERLAPFGQRAILIQASYTTLSSQLAGLDWPGLDGIVLDLGVSSLQFDTPERGFSFTHEAPLDMRFDPSAPLTAADIVNHWNQQELADVLYRYGEERRSRHIAAAIIAARPISTTTRLAQIVARAARQSPKGRIHPATRTFQALRIAVNHELDNLEAVLPQAVGALNPGGRLAVISFHSLEDRIVKRFFRSLSRDQYDDRQPVPQVARKASLQLITRKPITPSQQEQSENPRSRSAKLRIVEKIG